MTRKAQRGRQKRCLGAAALLLSACTSNVPADSYELANIEAGNIIPKSSPTAFVTAFETFCLPGVDDPAALPGHLRAADYVEFPEQGERPFRMFVVDDRRPAVAIAVTADGVFCGVTAESRTGQTTRVQASVAENFPAAMPVDPATVSRKAEQVWSVGGASPMTIFTLRLDRVVPPATLTYAVFKPK